MNDLTAAEARELVWENDGTNDLLEKALKRIEKKAKDGKSKCEFGGAYDNDMHISEGVYCKLGDLGYTLNQDICYYQTTCMWYLITFVSW